MIVVNPRNHWIKSAIFRVTFWIFANFGLCNYFLVLFSGDSIFESEKSREVRLNLSALSFLMQRTRAEIFRPTELKGPDCTVVVVFYWINRNLITGHSVVLWTDASTWTQACHAESPLRSLNQGRSHGSQFDPKIQTQICHHTALQAHGC